MYRHGLIAPILALADKYGSKWCVLESNADGACPSGGDQDFVKGEIDGCMNAIASELAGGGGPPERCDVALSFHAKRT